MLRLSLSTQTDPAEWARLIAALPAPHLLQTTAWAQVKAQTGWRPLYATWYDRQDRTCAAALILERSANLPGLPIALPVRVFYVPRGPLLDWSHHELRCSILVDLARIARERGALFIKIDPDAFAASKGIQVRSESGSGDDDPDEVEPLSNTEIQDLSADLLSLGWRISPEQVQFRNTVCLDLTPPPEELLMRMKPKTRYNIRLAERKGVRVRSAAPAEFSLLYRMYTETAARDDFVIRDEAYYLNAWETIHSAGMALPLIAEAEGNPLAAIVVYHFAGRAWYMHGMSTARRREWMPNHLLQWEAILRLKSLGISDYDLWGAPDVFDETDPMWGVYRFKLGLGGRTVLGLGAWDLPIRTRLYRLYTHTLPRLLDVMRRLGKERTRRAVTA